MWYVSADFLHKHNFSWREVAGLDPGQCMNMQVTSLMVTKPFFYRCKYNGTMLLNAAYDILNRATLEGVPTELNLVGCDMDYSGDKTHFYDGGTPDPLRIPREVMADHLQTLKDTYAGFHRIVTLGPPSILPFNQGDLDLVWKK